LNFQFDATWDRRKGAKEVPTSAGDLRRIAA
jgi:hypothetical protein